MGSDLRLHEVEKRTSTIDRGLGVLPQPPAQICCRAPMALFMPIGKSQVGNWPTAYSQ